MEDFETTKKELLQPVLFEVGAGLLDCQGFEYGVALLLFHLSRLGTPGLDPNKASLILDDAEKRTAGQLISMLKKHSNVSDDMKTVLEEALVARNYLVHRILIDRLEQLETPESRSALVLEIRRLRSKVRKADQILAPITMGLSEALDGLDYEKMKAEFVRKLSRQT